MHVGKKTLSALMALTLTASLAACSASTPADTTPRRHPSENLVQTSSTPSVDEEGAKRTEYPLTITTYNYNKEPVEYTFERPLSGYTPTPRTILRFCCLWGWPTASWPPAEWTVRLPPSWPASLQKLITTRTQAC